MGFMEELLVELKKTYGPDAEFREGQKEAIVSILNGKRTLVVQNWVGQKSCESYYADIEKAEGKDKNEIVDLFMKNQIKALV